jgi:hypothetical protein
MREKFQHKIVLTKLLKVFLEISKTFWDCKRQVQFEQAFLNNGIVKSLTRINIGILAVNVIHHHPYPLSMLES